MPLKSKKKPRQGVVQGTQLSAKSLLDLIPAHLYRSLSETYKSDERVSKLKSDLLFKLIIYSILSSESMSLRRMAFHAESSSFAFLTEVALDHLSHTSIRSRLISIDTGYFAGLYNYVYQELNGYYHARELSKKYELKRYDSTMVAVFSHLINGMRVGNSSNNKRQVKFTTELTGKNLLHMRFYYDQAHLGEEKALKEAILDREHNPKDIVIFDSGLKSRATFEEFHQKGIHFITRLNRNPLFEVNGPVEAKFEPWEPGNVELPDSAPVLSDQMVTLCKNRAVPIETPFRLIQVDISQDNPLYILTNITFLAPEVIAALYRLRWDIEVIFRFLKQEMELKHIVCYHPNAIQNMMYCMLIVAMLVLVFKAKNGIKSLRKARIMFFRQISSSALVDLLDDPFGLTFIKERLYHESGYG